MHKNCQVLSSYSVKETSGVYRELTLCKAFLQRLINFTLMEHIFSINSLSSM